jgi:hypothetical protein
VQQVLQVPKETLEMLVLKDSKVIKATKVIRVRKVHKVWKVYKEIQD